MNVEDKTSNSSVHSANANSVLLAGNMGCTPSSLEGIFTKCQISEIAVKQNQALAVTISVLFGSRKGIVPIEMEILSFSWEHPKALDRMLLAEREPPWIMFVSLLPVVTFLGRVGSLEGAQSPELWQEDVCSRTHLFWSLMKPAAIIFVSEIALTSFTSERFLWQSWCKLGLISVAF